METNAIAKIPDSLDHDNKVNKKPNPMTKIEVTDSEVIGKNTIDANKTVDAEEKKLIKTTENTP